MSPLLESKSLRAATCAPHEDGVLVSQMHLITALVLDVTTTARCALDSPCQDKSNDDLFIGDIVARCHLRTG